MALNASMKIDELLEILGYDEGSSPRKRLFVTEIDVFFREYLAQGHVIPHCQKTRSIPAVACAVQFLHQDSRAEKLWPLNAKDVVAVCSNSHVGKSLASCKRRVSSELLKQLPARSFLLVFPIFHSANSL